MRWRGKLVCLLFFYFAGFATAIYCLSPVPDEQNAFYGRQGFPQSAVKSDWFAKSANVTLRKAVNFTAKAALRTIEQIKQKSAEKSDDSSVSQSAAIHR